MGIPLVGKHRPLLVTLNTISTNRRSYQSKILYRRLVTGTAYQRKHSQTLYTLSFISLKSLLFKFILTWVLNQLIFPLCRDDLPQRLATFIAGSFFFWFLVVVSTTDDLLNIRSEQDGLKILAVPSNGGASELTCSNCAVYDPFLSTSGGYASTIPLETKLFN